MVIRLRILTFEVQGSLAHLYFLVVRKEERNLLHTGWTGIIFPYFLLATGMFGSQGKREKV